MSSGGSDERALATPTGEQDYALSLWARDDCTVVSAAAGAGKSTLLLHAVRRAPASSSVLILSYNKPLAVSMCDKLEGLKHEGLMPSCSSASAFTFHGLCSHLFALTPDDITMEETITNAKNGRLKMKAGWTLPTHVAVDEVQDMRPLHYDLIQLVLQACEKPPVIMLVGDPEQLLYDFEDPPATTEYMDNPESFFEGEWKHARLSTSFRLTPPLAAFVNAIAAQHGAPRLEAGNLGGRAPPPSVVTCSVWQWSNKLVSTVQSYLRDGTRPEDIGIIARSVRNSPPLQTLINSLSRSKIAMYVHGCDGADPKVRTGKVCVCTWHASKGLQWKVVFVLGVDGLSEQKPLHVALTRSSCHLHIINDARSPNISVLVAIAQGVAATVDDSTTAAVASKDKLSAPAPYQPGSGPRDVTALSLRGGVTHKLHSLIYDVGGIEAGQSSLPEELIVEVKTPSGPVWEDVTMLYIDAVLMAMEVERFGYSRRVREMANPVRTTRDERIARTLVGDRTRMVDNRQTNNELIPDEARAALNNHRLAPPLRFDAYGAAAAAASAFNGFHHKASRLSSGTWMNQHTFAQMCAVARTTIPHGTVFDQLVVLPVSDETPRALYARVDAQTDTESFTFVYGDRIGSAARIRAATALALSSNLERANIVNLRTGERMALVLKDRRQFVALMQ